MASSFKKTKVKLDLLRDINMSLMVEKGLRGGIRHSIYQYAKANNKYMNIMIKIMNRHIFNTVMLISDAIAYMNGPCSKNF